MNTKIGFFRLILIVERQLNAYKGFFFLSHFGSFRSVNKHVLSAAEICRC